jgi:hypothetical protein
MRRRRRAPAGATVPNTTGIIRLPKEPDDTDTKAGDSVLSIVPTVPEGPPGTSFISVTTGAPRKVKLIRNVMETNIGTSSVGDGGAPQAGEGLAQCAKLADHS